MMLGFASACKREEIKVAKTGLTITVAEDVAGAAREHAKLAGISLSDLVEAFLCAASERSSALRRLIGILPPDSDEAEYHRHLEKKYGA